ncbi:DUF4192 domain-containing protein [Nocardioides sp. ChNu-153]|uniref:DUF4192 domain-containing protein n=1 Tax=unclassified Nocardioides TaxID=2615069 RepID=UPI0024066ADD|nr:MULTISPECIES: DUF4192 domain-containing protein [unclassified Nocardioides]MDF9715588.1 DUF4192 domain-containing protein [Nocardioides sp. ChNu-99]MDN7121260.1 DUF4192 domain-containing protein [Nocardioides sp. ChNu-153]
MTEQRRTGPRPLRSVPASASPPATDPPVVRLRTPADVLAAVPVVLGFEPADSLAVLTFGADGASGRPGAPGRSGMHLRIDLPADPRDANLVVDAVVAPCVRHGVGVLAAVLYTDDAPLATAVADALRDRCWQEGLGLAVAVRADGRRWYDAGAGSVPTGAGTPYRNDTHPVRTRAVVDGRVVHRSRAAMAAQLAPLPPDRRRDVAAAVVRERRRVRRGEEAAWVRRTVLRALESGVEPAAADLARLLVALDVGVNRDAAWAGMTRPDALAHLDLWVPALRRAPEGARSGVAALVGLCAWLHGDGALAWCAVDVCLAEVADHGLGCLVRDLLLTATPPDWWEEVGAGELPSPA